ncbi:MAG TPA: protein phosphatase 2C domain-containing protein [Dictyobacter sp.]|jgi:protein phosphatase|nr:protein phosphatase 2C domain-containing protein [Dictyobacter sp.]
MMSSRWLVLCSERLYELLLLAYPTDFRREYRQEMLLTFRDCCWQELQQGGSGRLFHFWGTILPDFMKSVSVEHIQQFKNMFFRTKEYSMVATPFHVQSAQLTDIGLKRAKNEDTMISVLPEDSSVLSQKGALFIVADGLGGHHQGEVASSLAVNTIRDAYYQDQTHDIPTALTQAVRYANAVIYQATQEQGKQDAELLKAAMGTTCVAAVLKDHALYIANVGDSLAYLVHDQQVSQLAVDHALNAVLKRIGVHRADGTLNTAIDLDQLLQSSKEGGSVLAWVEGQVREGKVTKAEALAHVPSNIITRCLGSEAQVDVSLTTQEIQSGDILILCTDGLHTQVSEAEMRAIVERYTPEESTRQLIARANEHGGSDNTTAIVVKID